ncbi:MAG: hypothetical protein LBC44_00590 [Mycoplasmataceae bacterium]|nr:hypothetical protein [Mycoplasmataceae bacterium]
MDWLIAPILALLNGVFAPLLYMLLINAPLWLLNIIYTGFNWLVGANLGEMFFGVNAGQMTVNPKSEIFVWMVRVIIVAVAGCAIFFMFLVGVSVAKKEQINWIGKLKWPLLTFTSIIIFPIGFILLNTMSKVLFDLLNGGTDEWVLMRAQVDNFISDSNKGIDQLAHLTGLDDIGLVDINNTLHDNLTFKDIFNLMNQSLAEISAAAQEKGLTNIQNEAQTLMETISKLQNYFSAGENSVFNQDLISLQSVLESIGNNYVNDQLQSNMEIYNQLNPIIEKIEGMKTNWITVLDGFGKIENDIKYIPAFADLGNAVLNLGAQDYYFDIKRELLPAFSSSNVNTMCLKSLNAYLLGIDLKDDAGAKMMSLWDYLNVPKNGQGWEYNGAEFQYNPAISRDGEFPLVGISGMNIYNNTDIKNSFQLVVEIYRLVTNHTDSDWTKNYGWEVGIEKIGIGFCLVAMSIYVMALYVLFSIKRIFEILFLLVWLIIGTMKGIVDDGKLYLTSQRILIAKMFTAAVIFFAFQLSISISGIITNAVPMTDLTGGVLKALVMIVSMMAGYQMANWVATQFGDKSGLAETAQDIGMIKTGIGAGKMALGAAAAAGLGAAKSGGSGLNKLSGGKLAAGIDKAQNATGNVFRSKTWKANANLATVQNAAAEAGIGSFANTIDKNGKATRSFQLDPELAGAADIYNSMKGNRAFTYRAQQKLDKAEKLSQKPNVKSSKLEKVQKQATKIQNRREKK